MHENIAASAMFNGRLQIPFPRGAILDAVEEDHVVAPGQLCSNLLHN
jgi:hypothetical protein